MAILAIALLLSACNSALGPEVLRPTKVTATGKEVNILIATTRARSGDAFTAARATKVDLQSYSVSIPAKHSVGNIEWPGGSPGDPSGGFLVTHTSPIDRKELARALDARNNPSGEVAIFVHGYNVSYAEDVFRVAQLANDVGFDGQAIGFAWPSEGSMTGYLVDRDSATYSRDYLEQFLDELAAIEGVRKVTLVAHSMGNWLALETLRQAKLKNARSQIFGKLDEVVLMSPDVDIDVFRNELQDIGPLRKPINLLVSSDDKALGLAQALSNDVARVGNLDAADPRLIALAEETRLRIVDLSRLGSIDSYNHSKFLLAAPKLHEFVKSQPDRSRLAELSRSGILIIDPGSLFGSGQSSPSEEPRHYR